MVAMGLRWGALKGPRGGGRGNKKDRKSCYTHVRIGARARTSHGRGHTHTRVAKNCACIRNTYICVARTHSVEMR